MLYKFNFLSIILIKNNSMSKFSPFRKTICPSKREISPTLSPYNQNSRLVEKSRIGKSIIADYTQKRYLPNDQPQYKLTEKKRYDPFANIDFEGIVGKNKHLIAENGELYHMLEQRGIIIVILENKLQEQVKREVQTLEEMQRQKNIFLTESNNKFTQYQYRIDDLMQQVYRLNQSNYEKGIITGTMAKQHKAHMQTMSFNQTAIKDISEVERMKIQNIIEAKNHETNEIVFEFRSHVDQLKNEMIGMNNEILHLNHMRKIQLSQQKMMYETMIDGISREYEKQGEILMVQSQVEIKRLQNIIDAKASENDKIGEQKKITEIEQNAREQQLLEKKNQLQSQIRTIEEHYKKTTFDQTQRLKQLNNNEIKALQTGNEAIVNNLKSQNNKMINLNNLKSQQLQRLYSEIFSQRDQYTAQIKNIQDVIEGLKQKMKDMQGQYTIEGESLKVKWAQLREADLTTLKQFYEHEIKILNNHLFETNQVADDNRAKLHQELQQKNQMRKAFDIEIMKLQSLINDLELTLQHSLLSKNEQSSKLTNQIEMTSMLLLRESKEKEKYNQFSEEEKKQLQEFINAKDKEIEELGQKIQLLKEHSIKEVNQKNSEIQLIKKGKDGLDIELKKQKYFYENQVKKKDITIKTNKQIYEAQSERLKKSHRQQYDKAVKDLSSAKTQLEVELQNSKSNEKKLQDQIDTLHQHKTQDASSQQSTLIEQKNRHMEQKKKNQERLVKQYQQQIDRLSQDINDISLQLKYKEEDLRNLNDKYHRLEQKMDMLMESQEKLKNMENKIIALGQDNNMVKNLAEIIKSRKK